MTPEESSPSDPGRTRSLFLSLKNPRELAALLRISYSKLTYLLYRLPTSRTYRKFEIRKRSGGTRTILAPMPGLARLQRTLLGVLETVYQPRQCVHGFVASKSILTNARQHLDKRYVLNVDLKDFFPSINFGRVRGMFIAPPYKLPAPVATVLAQICCVKNQLPQGAPTSPIVSNMICTKLDNELLRLAQAHRCTYTRYADDITISTSLPRFPADLATLDLSSSLPIPLLGPKLQAIVESNGFKVNQRKISLQRTHWHQEATGLTVNEIVNTRRKYVRQVRSLLHAWREYGLEDAAKEHFERYRSADRPPGTKYPELFRTVIRGKIEFLRMIKGAGNPVYLRYADQLRRLDPTYRPGEQPVGLDEAGGHKDVFLCHASEDKADIVRPIARALETEHLTYWLDEAQISWGESLVGRVNDGLRHSRAVLVVLSRNFMTKNWPPKELEAALHMEISGKNVKVLPLLVGAEKEREAILQRNPLLAAKRHLVWDGQPLTVVSELRGAMRTIRKVITTKSGKPRRKLRKSR